MDRTWRVLELLASRSRIEDALTSSGIGVDAQCRDAIDRALVIFVGHANLDFEDVEARIVTGFLHANKEAA